MALLRVPSPLGIGSRWIAEDNNYDDLKMFLATHGLDMFEIFYLEFREKGLRVGMYKRGPDGKFLVNSREEAIRRYETVKYLLPRPEVLPPQGY